MKQLIIRHVDDRLIVTGNFGHQFVIQVEKLLGSKIKMMSLFNLINKAQIDFYLFFIPEVYAICDYFVKRLHRFRKYGINMDAVVELRTFLRDTYYNEEDIVTAKTDPYDYSIIDKKFKVKVLPHQDKAIRLYKQISHSLDYRGMLLYGDTGTGKTLTSLMIAELTLSDKIILVVPLQTIHRVWTNTIEERYKTKQDYYIVNETKSYTNQRIIITSYENIPRLLADTKLHNGDRTTLIVDESHNFADHKSNRTEHLLQLVTKLNCENNIIMSGTPIKSGFKELAIILKILDKRFIGPVISKFMVLYKSPTSFMGDVLRDRFNSHTARMEKDALKLDPVITDYIPITLPNGKIYTLDSIRKDLKEYVIERSRYYSENKSRYEETYKKLYLKAKEKLKNSIKEATFKEYEVEFNMVIRYFEKGILMQYPDLVKRVNQFEEKTLVPVLDGEDKTRFRDAKTILKYLVLKIQGEALANVVMRKRIEAHRDMATHLVYKDIIEHSRKKTIIFSNYTEVCDAALSKVTKLKYKPITVYGNTTKDLNQNVGIFINKKDVNPLVTTFKSLSTGVPLTVANTIIVLDLPFRMYVYEQAIARAWRLGQDTQVHVYIPKLDTGDAPNINSRNIDIIQYFKEEVEAITGHKMAISLDSTGDLTQEELDLFKYGSVSVEHFNPTNTMGVFERW